MVHYLLNTKLMSTIIILFGHVKLVFPKSFITLFKTGFYDKSVKPKRNELKLLN